MVARNASRLRGFMEPVYLAISCGLKNMLNCPISWATNGRSIGVAPAVNVPSNPGRPDTAAPAPRTAPPGV